MSEIQICGMRPLNGRIEIQGSKNAVLPMMAASILAKGVTVIRNVPAIADLFSMMEILESIGCTCSFHGGVLSVDTSGVSGTKIPREYVGKMRSSLLLLGPLLSRAGEAQTFYPGGCVIGERPVDLHLYALKKLGAGISETGDMIHAWAGKLTASTVAFRYPSVGATENALMAAATACGTTVLENCAREPEIVELCSFLTAMGAKITGAGEQTIVVDGVQTLFPCEFVLGGDRICAGTYLAAAVAVGGDIAVSGIRTSYLKEPLSAMKRMGAEIEEKETEVRLSMRKRPGAVRLFTAPYPGFPTDLQSVFLAACAAADGESRITENVFEARFAAAELMKQFGAKIRIDQRTAVVSGVYPLKPASVTAPDLRGGAALVAAALAADGVSLVRSSGHIERGYEDICRDFGNLGADVKNV